MVLLGTWEISSFLSVSMFLCTFPAGKFTDVEQQGPLQHQVLAVRTV